jgi:mannose-P-dolichol utilization defect protein 1
MPFEVFNYLFGSLSRIFTTIQEVDDPLILYGFIAGFVLNAVLAFQMLYYWNAKPAAKAAPAIRSQGKKGSAAEGIATGSQAKSRAPTTRRRG